MYNYTISIIENNRIERNTFDNEEGAKYAYNFYKALLGVECNGVQLWQHRKSKTIDNDPRARIIKQHYI